jgi:hypothetical protein
MAAEEPQLLRDVSQEGLLMQLQVLLLQMVQVSCAAITATVVVCTRVESAVNLGARGVARLSPPQRPAKAGLLDVAQLCGVFRRCHNVPQNVGWIADWVPQPRGPIQRDSAPSRLRGCRRETKKDL